MVFLISKLKLDDKPIEYTIISLLASMIMYGLLIRVVGAPNNFLITAIALLSGLSVATAIGSFFWAAGGDFANSSGATR